MIHKDFKRDLGECPFCANQSGMSFYTRNAGTSPAGYFVECFGCGASGGPVDVQGEAFDRHKYAQQKALEKWKCRP